MFRRHGGHRAAPSARLSPVTLLVALSLGVNNLAARSTTS